MNVPVQIALKGGNESVKMKNSGAPPAEEIDYRKISVTRKKTVEVRGSHPSANYAEGWGTHDDESLKMKNSGAPPATSSCPSMCIFWNPIRATMDLRSVIWP